MISAAAGPAPGDAPHHHRMQHGASPAKLFARGRAFATAGAWLEAANAFQAATVGAPQDPVLWLNLAHAHLQRNDFVQAAAAACRAVQLDHRSELGLGIAAQCFERTGRERDLIALFGSIDMTTIADPDLHLRLAMALTRLGRFQEAVNALFDVLRRNMQSTAAFAQLGNVFQLMKLPEEARESFRNALVLGRSPAEMITAILFTSLEACSWGALAADRVALDDVIARGQGQPTPFYCLNLPWTRAQQLAAEQAHARRLFQGIVPMAPPPRRDTAAPIRVGFVSSDFHEHATAYLIAELFERHDRTRFVFHAYSYGEDDGSPMRRRLESAFAGHFVQAREMSTTALTERIRADGIDVLIDLKGYTLYARNDVFAHRAAPIQVNFLGFPGSLGSQHYDYIIGDPIVTPLDHADGYAEKIAQLPHCYQPNDRRRPRGTPGSRTDHGLPAGGFVFCCLNANYKITPEVFDRWCSLLRQIDDAVLWLFITNAQARKNLAAEAQARGVDPARLVWAMGSPLAMHIGRMQHADLFLDTLPVNAHTTASDALWAGLPVLTVAGDSFVARVAASLVTAAGLPELVAADLDDYEHRALALARDRDRLAQLRSRLGEQRAAAPLFDSERYARDFGDLVARMVDRYDRQLPPDHLAAVAHSSTGLQVGACR